MLLVSCSKSENGDNPGKEAGKSKLTISLKGEKSISAPQSRAAGTPTEADESTISDFIVYVFKSDGSNDIAPQVVTVNSDADLTVTDLEITTDATEVYVLANTATTATTQTALKAVTKKSELQAVTGRLFADNTASGASSQTKTNLWMSGKADISPSYGGNVTAPVTLYYIPARLRITSVTIKDENLTNLSTDLVLNEITVLNAGGASKLIPAKDETSLIPTTPTPTTELPFYFAGMDMTNQSGKPAIYAQNDALKLVLTGGNSAKIDAANNPNYFYVFENNGIAFESKPTIITLKATYKTNRVVYYSVLFKADPAQDLGFDNQIIERGNSYDIAMTIKKLGNSEPSLPALKTEVDITITPAKWNPVVIEKVYE